MNFKKFLVFLHDVAATAVAWYAAFLLRFNFAIPPANLESLLWSMAIVVPLQAVVFWWYGLYRSLWRFASLPDLRRIVMAVFVS
ncbi:MAG TPA: polysaccharide biosynthesis protein, partial [Elusimicrobiota bacterium]|nr:polysaccharide biosynthesis protein [Elusimicrobiota bacterium]